MLPGVAVGARPMTIAHRRESGEHTIIEAQEAPGQDLRSVLVPVAVLLLAGRQASATTAAPAPQLS